MRVIPKRFVPLFCEKCGAPIRDRQPEDKQNQFVCSADGSHQRWIQSPPVAYVIAVDENGDTYPVRRAIAPKIGSICYAGGYVDYGDTAAETIVHESLDESCIDISGLDPIYLGQWFEEGGGVTVTGFLVRMHSSMIAPFVANAESSQRLKWNIWDTTRDDLAFNGNWMMLLAAQAKLKEQNGHDRLELKGRMIGEVIVVFAVLALLVMILNGVFI